MTIDLDMMTLNELIGFMSPELANEILDDTFVADKALYKAISAEVATALKLRPAFFEQKARSERNKIVLDMLTRPLCRRRPRRCSGAGW